MDSISLTFKSVKLKSVPAIIKKLENNGETEKLIKYKKQVKLVLKKLEDIKFALENEN